MMWKTVACLAVSAVALAACGQKTEAPSEAGTALTPAQVSTLSADRSLIGKRVSLTGYPMVCSMGRNYRSGDVVAVEIHAAHDCKSPTLASANIPLASQQAAKPGFGATGVRKRNQLLADNAFSNDTMTFLTDDYEVLPAASVVKVTGVVSYPFGDTNAPVLEAVALNAPAAS